jgi:F-type H+-transporting ATPase subunit b
MLRTCRLPLFALALLVLTALAGPAAAADDKGMFAPALDLGIWTLVVFLLLYFLLSKYAWKPMLEGLRKREESIRAAVDEAKLVREQAARDRADFDKKLADAYQEIPKIMETARRDAPQLKEEMRSQAVAEIQTERQRLHREIGMARDQALQEIYQQSALLATLISAKVLGRSVSEDDHRRLIDEALTELHESRGKALRPGN